VIRAALVIVLCLVTAQRLPRERWIWGHMIVAATFGVGVMPPPPVPPPPPPWSPPPL